MKNQDQTDAADYHKEQFFHLVMMFATSALQHLGRIPNPMTNQAQVDLEAAQATIDLLDMLETKTRGNLDPEESQMLAETLTSLKMNFVQAQQSGGAGAGARPNHREPPTAAPAPEPAAPKTASTPVSTPPPPPSDDDKKKYHKSYG